MPRTGRRIQVQFPPDVEAAVGRLAKKWSYTGEPLTPSQVIRECVMRISRSESKEQPKRATQSRYPA